MIAARTSFARNAVFGWVSIVLLVLPSVPAAAQVDYDRPGGDYTSFPLRSGDPAQCAARCERDSRCRAWGFSYPMTESSGAVCWLKSRVTARVPATCCVSGVRGASTRELGIGPYEFSIDRVGGDYRHFDLPSDPTGKGCQDACDGEDKCRAWTYVRPGYGGLSAACYLKSRITRPQRKPCCISGVVR
ncbi:MAG TPA: PAN domain-containing protein [Xanthobacteraceae bacterium]|jgi:hypothetical protein